MIKILKLLIFLKRLFVYTFFLSLCFTNVQAQKYRFIHRYWNSLINDTSDISKPQFLLYPTVAYAPETSWEIGLSSLYVYYAKRDTANRLSDINGFTFFTLENQYGIWFDHALYSDQNTWFFLGRSRFQSFPLLYFGIGPHTAPDPLANVKANQLWLRERVLRKIRSNLYFGLQIDLQRLSSVNFIANPEGNFYALPRGSSGSTNLGFGFGVVYDNRHNVLNVRKGFFSELSISRYDPLWGSTFGFSTLLSDTRIYKPINKRDVLAAQFLAQYTYGQIPFNQLALLGGESIMRGYYLGRFRDENQLATQVEYRFLPLPLGFSKRLGAAVFAGTGTVFSKSKYLSFDDLIWSAGAGIRFLLFPKKDIFTRLDIAFTREGTGLYIFIGEAF
jgi:hypothetical protein